MLQAIEEELILPPDGKLPEVFRPVFGHKVHVIVLLTEEVSKSEAQADQSAQLMAFSGTIDWPITDPLAWQRRQRNEWDRE